MNVSATQIYFYYLSKLVLLSSLDMKLDISSCFRNKFKNFKLHSAFDQFSPRFQEQSLSQALDNAPINRDDTTVDYRLDICFC